MSESVSTQNPFLRQLQVYIILLGLSFLLLGLLRLVIEQFFPNLGAVSPQLFTPSSLVLGLVYVVVGYGAIFTWAAIGASEPPALSAVRYTLMGFVLASLITLIWGLFVNWQLALFALLLTLVTGGAGGWFWSQAENRALWKIFGQPIYRHSGLNPLFYGVGLVALMLLAALGIIEGLLTYRIELPPQTPRQGDLLYLTTFDRFNDEWDLPQGRQAAEIVAGELELTESTGVSNAGFFALLEDRRFSDFDLRVSTHKKGGDIGHSHGVIFRWRNLENYYLFEISNDGYYRLTKTKDNIAENLTPWIESDLIQTGMSVNEIAITARDDVFTFYINGGLARLCLKGEGETAATLNPLTGECLSNNGNWEDRYIDSDFRQGKIALSVGTVEGSDLTEVVRVGFDNLVIVGP